MSLRLCQISVFFAAAATANSIPVQYENARFFGSPVSTRSDEYPKLAPQVQTNKYFSGAVPHHGFTFAHVTAYDQPNSLENLEEVPMVNSLDENSYFGNFISQGKPRPTPWGLHRTAADSFDLSKVPSNRGTPLDYNPRFEQPRVVTTRNANFAHKEPYSEESYYRQRSEDNYIVREAASRATYPLGMLEISTVPISSSSCGELKWEVKGQVCGQEKSECEQKNKIHDAGKEYCTSIGARLCSKKELEDKLGAHKGCGFDSQFVWSSTPCGVDKYSAVKCNSGNKKAEAKCAQASDTSIMGGRCCADVSDKPTKAPTLQPTPFPTTNPTNAPTSGPTVQPPLVSEDKTALVVVGQQSITFRGGFLSAAQTLEFSTDPPAAAGVVIPTGNVTALGGDGASATITLSKGLDASMEGYAIRLSVYDLVTRQRNPMTTITAPVVKPNDFVGNLYVTSVASDVKTGATLDALNQKKVTATKVAAKKVSAKRVAAKKVATKKVAAKKVAVKKVLAAKKANPTAIKVSSNVTSSKKL